MIRVSIIGATGYVGLELIRLLQTHPQVDIMHLVSSSNAGEPITDIYPGCESVQLPTLEELDVELLSKDTDVFFTALPHGASQDTIEQLYQTGKIVIDMSGDFRYDDPNVYAQWYRCEHTNPVLLEKAVYGMPELHRTEIKKARLIGNPGCYTTASILALAPLLKNHMIDTNNILIDAKSGSTGAGRKTSALMQFCEINENMKAYGIGTHRHTSEIEQELSKIANETIMLSFTPHLLPINRGILATCYATLLDKNTMDQTIHEMYKKMYKYEPFVHVCDLGKHPKIRYVVGSNLISIGFQIDRRLNRIVVISCIDNLIKGAAGQAIQNMNIICGFEETEGLSKMPWTI